jgi:hypothetical protein
MELHYPSATGQVTAIIFYRQPKLIRGLEAMTKDGLQRLTLIPLNCHI